MPVNELISLMSSPTNEDIELITKAMNFAENVHKDQKRYSGEPYFIHPFETAKILAKIGMSAKTIAGGLLHDTVEDVGVKEETIKAEFGDEILFLIQGVTKLGRLRYHGTERHIESLKKLFIAMSKDLRILIIKLADRLHNMRTLEFVPKEKQRRIALETLEIYAPLADRLGISSITRELQDLSFKYVNPKEYNEASKIMKEKSKENLDQLEKFRKSVQKELAKAGIVNIHTDYRIKGIYSFYKKLERKNMDIDKVYDISALRIIVPTVNDCYSVLGIIHSVWRPLPGRIKDYIAFPKPNGYQSLHTTVFTGEGSINEVQIRTTEMHKESEFGIASHLYYKEKNSKDGNKNGWGKYFIPLWGNNDSRKDMLEIVPTWVKQLAETEEKAENGKDFMDNLKNDFFEYRIFIFTPKGDVVDLPIDSTPIDFAYAIHSDIGNHMTGAKVNGKLISLDRRLKNGDIVEILTKKTAKPSSKWLEFAKTSMARKHIESSVKTRQ